VPHSETIRPSRAMPPGPGSDPAAVPGGLATASVVLACAWTALQAVHLVTSFPAGADFDAATSVGADLTRVWTAYDTVGLAFFPVQVAAFVVTCLWLQRSRRLADSLRPRVDQERGAAWVWFGWFVPIVSLWFPYQVVRDVRAASVGTRRLPGIGWWWAAWVVANLTTTQAALASMGAGAFRPGALPLLEAVVTVSTALALVGWVRIVREITAAQRHRLAAA
jgi:hypothetical protein